MKERLSKRTRERDRRSERQRQTESAILVCIHNPTGVDSWCEREILQEKERDRGTERQTEGQRDRQTDRGTERERDTGMYT